ncbi:patatin-like protein [Streptomyces sp. NPDC002446]
MSMDEADGQTETSHLRSELRLAATFTGGVSLAVWMGGVAREMNLLTGADRPGVNAPAAHKDQRVRAKYQQLLRLLRLDVSVDVLSGTSAGGINAAVLGLATVRGCDIGILRDLWLDEGSLGALLRNPSEHAPPSLLQGDEVLLRGLRQALQELVSDAPDARGVADDPTRVFITTTLLAGLERTFGDDYGSPIRDTIHQGLFTFNGQQLSDDAVVAPLALAARSSASFPGAFEPSFVPVGTAGTDDGHVDMAPYVRDDTRTQFCADGGLLANRPLGPALQAVFDRPAEREVHRILAYVVPSPGLPAPSAAAAPLQGDIPAVGPALIADLNALQSQSITAELTALATHNERARTRQRAESRLALLAGPKGNLAVGQLHTEFRAIQAQSLARAAANETLRQLTSDGARAADDRPVGFGADLDTLTTAAAATIREALPADLAATDDNLFDQLAWFGRSVLDGAKATVLRLVKGGFDMPSANREALDQLVSEVHHAMPARSAADLSAKIREVLTSDVPLPPDGVSELASSPAWLAAVRSQLPTAERSDLADAWRALADVVLRARDILLPPQPADVALAADLTAILHHLTDTALETHPPDEPAPVVARRLFYLQAAERVLYPDEPAAQQVVKLAQMSANTRTNLDPRTLAEEKLTGLQLHHFGAFYKRSWRANDWMWGRLDGAGWLVHVLLSPRLLARLASNLGEPFEQELRTGLCDIAGTEEPPPGVFDPFPDGRPGELAFLRAPGAPYDLPPSFPTTSLWVASGLQRLIAAEELSCVAQQAELDRKEGTADTAKEFLAAYHRKAAAQGPDSAAPLQPDDIEELLAACRISQETFAEERGTKLLTRTIVRSAAVAVNAVEAGTVGGKYLRLPFRVVSKTLRLIDHLLHR